MDHPFLKLWNKPSRLVVGLMSGTSADGIDAVLTRITGSGQSTKAEQLEFYFQPFDAETRRAILSRRIWDWTAMPKKRLPLRFRPTRPFSPCPTTPHRQPAQPTVWSWAGSISD